MQPLLELLVRLHSQNVCIQRTLTLLCLLQCFPVFLLPDFSFLGSISK